MAALYIHIPFCLSKCHYCSFVSCAGGRELYEPYVAALIKELTVIAGKARSPLDSVFIGGGTPSVLPSSLLAGIVAHCHALFVMASGAEISVESNPGTVDERYLRDLFQAGVNRLSLGVQSFEEGELKRIGRVHSGEDALLAMQSARNAGFANINLDLMYGLPGQTTQSWSESLGKALSLQPEHLSLYQLTIESGTLLADVINTGNLALPDEDEIIDMDQQTRRICLATGMLQYEISNYSLAGYACRHNINYWMNGEYFACGTSAVSFIEGRRDKRTSDTLEYIDRIGRGLSAVDESECLTREASFRETVIMGLRMVDGVCCATLFQRYDIDLVQYYGATLTRLLQLQLVELTDTHLRLTDSGRILANQIMAELV